MKNRPDILWLHPHFLNWMGGHKYIYEVVVRLSRKYRVTIASAKFSPEAIKKFKAKQIKTFELSGISTNNPLYWLFLPYFILKDALRLRKVIYKYKVVISSMFPMNIVAMILGIKHIQLCYEPYAFFYDENFINGFTAMQRFFLNLAKIMYSWIDKLATRDAEVVLTLSDFNKRWIRTIYKRNSIIVYEGVDTGFFRATSNKELEKRYFSYKVLFHSTDFTRIKGTEYLFKALPLIRESIPNVKLLISSTIQNNSEKNKLLKYAGEKGFNDSIEFLGFVPLDLLPAYLSLAKVVVQPSIGQSMSLTVKEAMSCSTPVVTSLEGKEQFKNREAGYLVDPKESENLAGSVVKLLKDDKIAKNMGLNGVRIVREKFSWDAVCGKIEKQIDLLCND